MASISDQSSVSSNPSLSSAQRYIYDVFLSFRGEDTRRNFISHLYHALKQKSICTFIDDDEIGAGEKIMIALVEAIKSSRFSIVVFSENYANSSWCLRELVHILKCSKKGEHTIYPVFYHVDPSDVRNQKGIFGKGFNEAASKYQMEAEKWRQALQEVASLKGYTYSSATHGSESGFIQELVGRIFAESHYTYTSPAEGLVGMNSRMEQVIKLLDLDSDETRVVGLWGMGGIGKTTLAKAVYESISRQFENFSFIENVREVLEKNGMKALQEQIILDVLMEKDLKIGNSIIGRNIIRQRVCCKKVLIILDDVVGSTEVKSLVQELQQSSQGSRIIVTTRDKHVLTMSGVQYVYNVKELNYDEALELFKSHAFPENKETEEYVRFFGRALKYATGVPLALKVLGSFLSGQCIQEWQRALHELKEIPDDEVQRVLKVSFYGLNTKVKNIFLDVCFFFKGKHILEVIDILDGCGFDSAIGIRELVQKSLLIITSNDRLGMHDLVQKMGRSIVYEESPTDPGERSRLCDQDDIRRVLMRNDGTKKVEGVVMDYPNKIKNVKLFRLKQLKLSPDAFEKMSNLRFLQICYTCISIHLPNSLCYLNWCGYPLKCMPSLFKPEDLTQLHLTYSRIQRLWDGEMVLGKLKIMNLSHSTYLTKCPDFTGVPNLEQLILKGCTSLVNLHPSIKKLKNLIFLDMADCRNLKSIPYGIESIKFKILIFSGCLKLRNILESFGDLKQLLMLYLNGSGIIEVPPSIGNFTKLWYLNLSRCKNLKSIPSTIGHLKALKQLLFIGCSNLSELPNEVGHLDSLEILDIAYSGIRQLPPSVVNLRNLELLSFHGCRETPSASWDCSYIISLRLFCERLDPMPLTLPSLSGFESLMTLNLQYCHLKSIPESISGCLSLTHLYLSGNDFESLPASIKDLSNLGTLLLAYCKSLRELPELPSSVGRLMVSDCESLETICSPYIYRDAKALWFAKCSKLVGNKEINILLGKEFLSSQIKVNDREPYRVYTGPGSEIPVWFDVQTVGPSIELPLPLDDLYASNFAGFAFAAVIVTEGRDCKIGVQLSIGGSTSNCVWAFFFAGGFENVFIIYFPIDRFKVAEFRLGGSVFEVCFATAEYHGKTWTAPAEKVSGPAPEVKKCGAHLIYRDESIFPQNDVSPAVTVL